MSLMYTMDYFSLYTHCFFTIFKLLKNVTNYTIPIWRNVTFKSQMPPFAMALNLARSALNVKKIFSYR